MKLNNKKILSERLTRPAVAAITALKESTVAQVGELVDDAVTEKTLGITARNQAEAFAAATQQNQVNTQAFSALAQLYAESINQYNKDLGPYDATANAPALSADSSAFDGFFNITVPGTVTFAGVNFAANSAFNAGDQLRKIGNQWYRRPFALADNTVSQNKLESVLNGFLTFLRSTLAESDFYDLSVVDENGWPILTFEDGVLDIPELLATVINGVEFTHTDDYLLLSTDPEGYEAFSVDNDGNVYSPKLNTDAVEMGNNPLLRMESDGSGGFVFKNSTTGQVIMKISTDGVEIADLRVLVNDSDQYPVALIDEEGWAVNGMDRDGNILSETDGDDEDDDVGFEYDVNHILTISQSEGFGGSAGPALGTVPVDPNCIMFNMGNRTLDTSNTPQNGRNVFVEHVQSGLEGPQWGMALALKQRMAEDGYVLSPNFQLLFSCPGKADTPLSGLKKGTVPYQSMLWDVEYGKKIANGQGKTYGVPVVFFPHGVADALNSNYEEEFIAFQYDVNRDIMERTGQSKPPRWVLYQTASFNAFAVGVQPIVAYEQLSIVENKTIKRTYHVGSTYKYTFGPDNVHFTNSESRNWGIDVGNCIYEIVFKKPEETHLRVTDVLYQDKMLELEFAAPQLPLVFDTTDITDPGHYGFRLFADERNASEITISNIRIVRGNRVRITSPVAITRGMRVTYGVNGTTGESGKTQGMRGNLYDSYLKVIDPTGINRRVRNVSPIFQITIN